MRIMAGEDKEFDGTLNLKPGNKIGYLPQEPVLNETATVLQNVQTAVQPVKDMIKEFEEVGI
jgi:sulfate-transporting ATPase